MERKRCCKIREGTGVYPMATVAMKPIITRRLASARRATAATSKKSCAGGMTCMTGS